MGKEDLLIKPIIQYVLHEVSRAGSEPELLSGEPILCEKFKVARGTVRRAMAQLIERGYVIQLPKRRGYFSNPKFSRFGELHIGPGFLYWRRAGATLCCNPDYRLVINK